MKIERQTFDMTLVPAVYLSLGLLCGTKKLISYFPNTASKGLFASSAISAATAIASACLFKEDSAKRRTAVIFSASLSVVFLPEAIKKLYNIKKPSGYPKFFVVQALTYVFLENFRDSSCIEVQPQEEQSSDGDDKKSDGDDKKSDGDDKKSDGDDKKSDGDDSKNEAKNLEDMISETPEWT